MKCHVNLGITGKLAIFGTAPHHTELVDFLQGCYFYAHYLGRAHTRSHVKGITQMFTPRMLVVLVIFTFTPALVAQTPATEMLTNGDFQLGNTGFASTYLYQDPAATSPSTVFEQGTYTVAPNLMSPIVLHPSPGLPNYYDHTYGNSKGMFMIINGSTTADKTFWSSSLSVLPNSFYSFSMWLSVWNNSSDNLPQIQVDFNGTTAMIAIPTLPLGTWTNFTTTWFSGSSTSLQIDLQNNVLDYGGNDFGMDDVSFNLIGSAVPEPGTLALMGMALLGTGGYWVYQRRTRRVSSRRLAAK